MILVLNVTTSCIMRRISIGSLINYIEPIANGEMLGRQSIQVHLHEVTLRKGEQVPRHVAAAVGKGRSGEIMRAKVEKMKAYTETTASLPKGKGVLVFSQGSDYCLNR